MWHTMRSIAGERAVSVPMISVVIPSLNCRNQISGLLRSIAEQQCCDLELIFSDGGSEDGTLEEVARQTQDLGIEIVTIIKKGSSIYGAINLGISIARGSWIQVMGSDDTYYSAGVLQHVISFLRQSRADVVYGDAWFEGGGGFVYGGPFWANRLATSNICHQSIFYRASSIRRLGVEYNDKYPVYADWDYNLYLFSRLRFEHLPLLISRFSCAGKSSTLGDPLFDQERYRCFYEYLGLRAFWLLSPDWLTLCVSAKPGPLGFLALGINRAIYKSLRFISSGRIGRYSQSLGHMVYSGEEPPANLASY